MIRKLSLAVAVATALSPLGALALGLGEIHTQSALNQNFKADIDLLSISKDEIQDVRVGLASPEAFAKAGIERPFLITGLIFTPSLAPDGRVVIAVTSQDPIREPFLDFLIEVNWPKGRLMREYTVLLDPPVTLDRQPAPLQAPKVGTAPVRQISPVQRSRETSTADYTAIAAPAGSREYGPIQTNDNLWNIAKQLKESGETTEQVMMALQRYNPDAFIRDNVNGLKVGKILRLPEGADVASVSAREARKEFLAQTREWREGHDSVATAESPEQAEPRVAPVASQQDDRLELISAKTDEEQEALDQEGAAEEAEEVTRLQQELMLVREANESSKQENQVLRDRVLELESQISDTQRLLTLKNDQLAQLQANQGIVEEMAGAMEAAPEVVEESPTEAMPDMAGDREMVTETVIEEADIETAITEATQQEQLMAEAREAAAADIPAEPEPAPVAEAPMPAPAEPASMPQETPQQEAKTGGFLDTLKGDNTLMAIVGGVGLLLLSLLWLIMRRRKEAEAEFAESILVTPEVGAAMGAGAGSTGSINEPTDETSFMSDFSPSDIDALQDETGEVDPLSEADVYIAYGRYQQAEELVRQAIDRFPEREDLKHKLLEIHYSAKNTARFSQLAEELKKGGLEEKKPDVWAKITAMGKELDPGNALFAAGAVAAAAAAGGAALGSEVDELDDLGLNLESGLLDEDFTPSAEPLSSGSGSESDDLDSIDLSGLDNLDQMDSENLEAELSLDSEFLNTIESGKPQAEEAGESLDMDLNELGTDSESLFGTQDDSLDLSSPLEEPSAISEMDLGDFDFDSQAVSGDAAIRIDDSGSLDDLDLDSLEKELESLSGDLEPPSGLVSEGDELSLPEDTPSEGMDLDDTDEVTTKLDLARAYVDMGDSEGAKGILEEVVNEGSEDQQQQARELLDNIFG